jgi:hypothetical protein
MKKQHIPYGWLMLCLLASGLGGFVANLLFYYLFG